MVLLVRSRHVVDLTTLSTNTLTGTISVKQARYALQSLGLNVDKEQLKSVADDNNDKKIHIDVFTQVLAGPKLVQRQKALRAFDLFDKDGKGVICVEDLQRVALELGETSMTQLQLEEMVNDADMEGQGFLSKEDFLAVAETLNL